MFLRNSYYNIILIILFFLILLLPTADNIFKFSKHFPITLKENRNLTEFPSIRKANGKIGGGPLKRFPKKFEKYYSDHFGLRNITVNLGNKIFLSQEGGSKGYIIGQDDWIFINSKTVNDALGLMPLKEFQVNKAVEHLYNSWQFLKKRGIDYLFVLIPTKQTMYPEYLPQYMASVIQKKKNIVTGSDQVVLKLLSRYPNFPILDLRVLLKESQQREDRKILYDKTDMHWNGLGVKYGYEAIYDALKKRNILINKTQFSLDQKLISDGDLADMSGRHPEYISSIVNIKRPISKKIENSLLVSDLKKQMRDHYNIKTNVEFSLYSGSVNNGTRAYIQHDSYFRYDYDMHNVLADSFQDTLFTYNPMRSSLLCEVYQENIKLYKPNLVIHEMIERDLIEYCKK